MTNIYSLWKYKYQLTIQNPSSTEGFQASFMLRFLPGMRYDFRDIRFADKRGNRLYYTIEYYTPFSSAKVWVRLPANDTEIYIYYGNGKAVSEINSSRVFDFYDGFTSLSSSKWTVVHGSASVSDGNLLVGHTSLNSIIESVQTFAPGVLVEVRAYHPAINRTMVGFRSTSTQKACCWHGTVLGDSTYKDYRFTHNGSSGTWTSDGVSRGGTTFYTYGVVNLISNVKHYIDGSLRGTATSTLPGNVSLPIHFYSEYNKGNLVVNWVRVRKYTATEPIIALGKKYIQNTNGFLQQRDFFSDEVSTLVSTNASIHDYFVDSVTTYVRTGFMIGQPDPIDDSVITEVTSADGEIIERRELRDYSLISCDITKSISDAYMQLSAEFSDDVVQGEGSTVKYYAHDPLEGIENFPLYTADGYPVFTDDGYPVLTSEIPDGFPLYTADGYLITTDDGYPIYTDDYYLLPFSGNLLFIGKVISITPSVSFMGNTARMFAADLSRNLSVQKIPWNYQVISLNDTFSRWDLWISELIGTSKTGVRTGNIIDSGKPDKQFVFDPKTSRFEVIKKISEYMGCILHVKIKEHAVDNNPVLSPTVYLVPAADIDQEYGGFDLPDPIEFIAPDPSIINEPEITGEQDEKYNKVIIYGTLTSTGETTVAAAYTPAVFEGQEMAREYIVNDNNIEEKGSTAAIEAIKWLLYFTAPRATVSIKFVERYDLELFQRIRFGSGFQKELKNLTTSTQLPYVVAYDPRDENNSTHVVDVSGVPRPSWLRISEIRYHSAAREETCEIKAITDYIHSSADPVVLAPYSQYIAPGYLKPVSDDTASTVQSIVEDTVEKQLSPEVCTLLSKNEENGTAVVQTASGKLVTVRIS